MRVESSPLTDAAARPGWRLTYESVLALLLAAEVAAFSVLGKNFLSAGNGFELVRLAVEVGLLALALTPVIVTGGIDLSVGSLMGLSAVVFGMLWRDGLAINLGGGEVLRLLPPVPIPVAAAAALLLSALAGGLNALLITRLRLPPLIVTLGTFSLFRGLGEGLTRSVEHYSGWPKGFLFVGQGYLPGGIPAQLPLLLLAVVGFWVLLQRTTIGRGLYAIGLSPEGARHAGIPVGRRLALVYVLSGFVAGVASIVYVAHMDEAKADAGTGFELTAITAVVLGGTSIFGGRGTIAGTVLGLFAIVVLQNGLRLAALPAELAGILTGVLLLAAISIERLSGGRFEKPSAHQDGFSNRPTTEEWEVKNSQVAVLGAMILAGALIVAGSNWLLARNLRAETPAAGGAGAAPAAARMTNAMMPKSKG
ncbi:MAG TPA: ABC transporter permease, partial [Gemmataceae bacterium]|nr:ABC transporter permease [Gemmataceae bacterium]